VAALGGCGGALPDGADGGAGSGGAGGGSDGGDALACGRMANPKPSDPLATTQWAMVTSWVGTATLPQGWTGQNPFGVEITFRADGRYRARSIDGSGQLPFYYDQNPDDGRYDLLLHSNGDVTGEIYLDGGMRADALSVLRFDAVQMHLHISVGHDAAAADHGHGVHARRSGVLKREPGVVVIHSRRVPRCPPLPAPVWEPRSSRNESSRAQPARVSEQGRTAS